MTHPSVNLYSPVVAVFCSEYGQKCNQTFMTIEYDDAGRNTLPNVETFHATFPEFHGKIFPFTLIIKKDGFRLLETVYYIEMDMREPAVKEFTHSVWKYGEHTLEPCSQMIIDHIKTMTPDDIWSGPHHTDDATQAFCDLVSGQGSTRPPCWTRGEHFTDNLDDYKSFLPHYKH
jgi:hypothetical protein